MGRGKALRLAVTVAVLFATLPASPATGGSAQGPATTDLEVVLVDVLGLDPDQAAMFGESLNAVGDDYDEFGWGGDASVSATLTDEDVPWSTPVGVGLNYVSFQDSELPDFSAPIDGMVMGTTDGGIQSGGTFAVATAVMGDDIPLSSTISGLRGRPTLLKQFDFALRVATLFAWVGFSQFPDDTWKAASFVMSLAYGLDPWALSFYMFSEDGQSVLPMNFPGFFIIYGNMLMVAVLVSAFGSPFSPFDVGVRFAADIKNAPSSPDESRVVRAPSGAPTADSFFDVYDHRTVPGLDGRFDPYEVRPFAGPDGYFWFDILPRTPWGSTPPNGEQFSYYIQVGIHGDPALEFPTEYVGYQQHKGESELFGSGPDGPIDGARGYIQDDGSILLQTPWAFGGEPTTFGFDGGNLPTEGGDFKWNGFTETFDPSVVVQEDDPTRFGGGYPVYDLTTEQPIDPPPETTTTTTQPATTTETTQPATTTETTVVTGTTTTTRQRTSTSEEACWWCWGVVLLFLAVLLCLLYVWLKSYEWWTCWLPWAIVIFVWVPFLLAGLWWWRPAWWWVPLLAWFPLVVGYWWYWARHRSWWQPWHVYVVGGYLVALALGMILVGAPEWGLLLPLFWVPWVGFYLWFRGARQAWWRPWMWLFFAGYVAWGFVWVIALSPWWAWWFPVVFFPVVGWWFVSHGYDWGIIHGPKWCWIVPFAFLPFFAWWIPLWGPWWCFVIILFLAMTLFCAIFNHFWEEEWWTCWIPWFLVIWVGIPFLLAGLWFFGPNWWWLPLLAWFAVIPGAAWWWGRHRGWWQRWHWYVVWGYLALAGVAMYLVGSPTWGLLFPVFWLGPVAFYLWYRPRRRPWFRPWMWGLFGAYVGWVFVWVIWLTPWWGWWFPVFFLPFFGWWGMTHGYQEDVWTHKSCAVVPMALLPWLGYMLAVYCIPAYYWL